METSVELELEFTIMIMYTFQRKELPRFPSKTKSSLKLKLEKWKSWSVSCRLFWTWEVFI